VAPTSTTGSRARLGQNAGMTVDPGTDAQLLSAAPATQRTPSVFGVVVEGARRRRPGDIVRVGLAALVVETTALGADEVTTLERQWFQVVAEVPEWLRSSGELAYRLGSVGTVVVILVALLATRRWRLFATVGVAGAIGYLLAIGLRSLLDLDQIRRANGMVLDGSIPEYPVVALACSTTVMLVVAPYLLRPARRMVFGLLASATVGAVIGIVGLLDDVAASLALGWGVAAALHLVIGTPAATPSRNQAAETLRPSAYRSPASSSRPRPRRSGARPASARSRPTATSSPSK